MRRPALVLAILAAAVTVSPVRAALRINGSTTVNPVVVDAAAELRAARGGEIQVDTLGGSSGGIAALGDGRADVAMSSRPILESDRERYPGVDFRATAIGSDALALVVSRDVWEGGLRSLTRPQLLALYEGRIRNWRELGGPDRRVVFFNKEPGRGTWEVFAHWAYGDSSEAPLVSLPEVGSNEEARSKVASTRGAISQLSAAWADGERVFALGIELADGSVVRPTPQAVAAGEYPLSRPLFLVTDGEAGRDARELIDFLLGARGREIVERHGYLPASPAVTTPEEAP